MGLPWNLRLALRALGRTPSVTALAIATLAIGIGATTTIFTVMHGVLLRPLPYEAPERLAIIWNDLGQGAQSLPAVNALDFLDYRERSRAFEGFAAASGPGLVRLRGNLTGEGDPERVSVSPVTANFFPLLGVTPMLGRSLTAEEEQPNGPHVAMLSYRLWQRRYAGDPSIVGRTIAVDGIAHQVVGILPESFRLHLPAEAFMVTDAEVWVPLQFDYGRAPPRNFTGFSVFGRLAKGRTWAQAQAEMDAIAAQLRSEHPVHAASGLRIRVIPMLEDVVKHARPTLLLLMGAVGLPGRAFLPLLSSFACAIPGILATRTIENRRDRLATIFVAPFMSCSARLPVYALLIGAFIPNLGWGPLSLPGLVLFLLYTFGIAVAFVTAWALRRTVLRGPRASSVMELPPYRTPAWRGLFATIRSQSFEFVKKAGTIIVAVSAVLWFLASYPGGAPETRAIEERLVAAERSGDAGAADALRQEAAGSALRHSFAGRIGHALEPVIEPLGFDWKIGIGLVTSFAAREVMVSTMATVWNMGNADENAVSLRQAMREAKDPATGRAAYPPLTGVSLMVFFALACQCMSTVAVVRRETGTWTWPLLMLVSMNVLAWIASFAVFQGGRALGWGA